MAKTLTSLGLDLGTTTTQLVISLLTAENRAPGFAVPRMEIGERKVIYESPIHFTPLISGELVDGAALSKLLEAEFRRAGVTADSLDTGAVIVTGETSRKENAQTVTRMLAAQAGKFVVATAGPDLESVLAARGAGAAAYSKETGKTVIHLDIGGGTANLALCREGKVEAAGCFNVGGRLMKFDKDGWITYVSPVLTGLTDHRVGDVLSREQAMAVARMLAQALEEAVGLREPTGLGEKLRTAGSVKCDLPKGVFSFSGGVADCIGEDRPWLSYGDLGPLLGQAIRESRLCRGEYRLGEQTIRATVIGAGCHSATLSGSTVCLEGVTLPMKDLPVGCITEEEQEDPELWRLVRQRLEGKEVLFLPGWEAPGYEKICHLSDQLVKGFGDKPCRVALERDMAKALGTALMLRLGPNVMCLDGVWIGPDSYLDVGEWVGPAVTVVVKTLAFG